MSKHALLAVAITLALAGCKKPEEAASAPAEPAPVAPATSNETAPAAPAEAAPVAASPAKSFDVAALPVSDKPLGDWPYIALPAGYELDEADKVREHTKDLARVPVWDGTGLQWIEGKVFVDDLEAQEGKTWSQFEVRKGLQQAIEALGGVRVAEGTFDETFYRANEEALAPFRNEFDEMHSAYYYATQGVDTYAIRRVDKLLWVVPLIENNDGALMVVEAPLPPPAR